MGTFLVASDLTPFAEIDPVKAAAMIEDAEAMAVLVAPCLGTPASLTDAQRGAIRALLRSAILRWDEAGSGARKSVTTGPFSETIDTTQQRRGMFWPSEITSLQGICSKGQGGQAYSVDTVGYASIHDAMCSLNFGAKYCSCGADIAGFPLWVGTP